MSLWLGVSFAAAVIIALVVMPARRATDDVHFKGHRLQVLFKRGSETRIAQSSDRLRTGDELRFHYRPPRDGYVMVVDIDSTGRVQSFAPFGAGRIDALAVSPADESLLPGAVALDSQPGPEHLIAFFHPHAFQLDDVRPCIQPKGTVPPTVSCASPYEVEELTLSKDDIP